MHTGTNALKYDHTVFQISIKFYRQSWIHNITNGEPWDFAKPSTVSGACGSHNQAWLSLHALPKLHYLAQNGTHAAWPLPLDSAQS